jgi:hypothetical protein
VVARRIEVIETKFTIGFPYVYFRLVVGLDNDTSIASRNMAFMLPTASEHRKKLIIESGAKLNKGYLAGLFWTGN